MIVKRLALIGLCAFILGGATLAEALTIRVATLAPRRSSWMRYFRRMAKKIKKGTEGRVKFKFYPDGVMGDEALVVEKMRLGQLQGAAVTNIGLGKIAPSFLVQQLPMMFRSYRQLDCLRRKMADTFTSMMREKGFEPIGYGDVGRIYLFTNQRGATPDELQSAKIWEWKDDPTTERVLKYAKLNGVKLGVPDVLSSLQSGLIDAFPSSPYAAIALQWFTKAKYVLSIPIAMAVGAVVITKTAWDQISDADKEVVRKIAKKWTGRLNRRIRRDNKRAVRALKKQGVEVVKVSKAAKKVWRKIAKRVQNHFKGKLYSASLFDKVRATLRSCR